MDSEGLSMSAPLRQRIWDAPTRLFHWLLVVLIVFSWWSAESDHMDWHILSGLTVLGLIAFRLIWGFIGSTTARFSHFLRGPLAVRRYLEDVRAKRAAAILGHNPLGGWSVAALLLTLVVLVVAGLYSVDVDGIESGPLAYLASFDTGRFAASIHHLSFNVLLGLVGLHLCAILFYLFVKRDNLVGPMITGSRPAGPAAAEPLHFASLGRAIVVAIIVAAIVWATSKGFPFPMSTPVTFLFAAALAVAAFSSAPATAAIKDPTLPEGFQVVVVEKNEVIADGQGRLIYTFIPDKADTPSCIDTHTGPVVYDPAAGEAPQRGLDACAEFWGPLTVEPGVKPVGDWKPLPAAKDQPAQWAYKRKPVYFYRAGGDPGMRTLNGSANETWHLIRFTPALPTVTGPGGIKPLRIVGQFILTDDRGRPLYLNGCTDNCAGWTPFPAGMAALNVGKWTVRRDRDQPQWAYAGQPVYTFDADSDGAPPKGTEQNGRLITP